MFAQAGLCIIGTLPEPRNAQLERALPILSFSVPVTVDTTMCGFCPAPRRCPDDSKKEDGCLFHPLTESDLPQLWERQQRLHALSSEFDAFRLFAWLPLDQTEVMYWRDQYALRFRMQGQAWYLAPYEAEDFPALLEALAAHERTCGGTVLRFLNVERPLSAFPAGFTAIPRRDLHDYLYRAEDLICMKGRAFAAKRNLISQFKRRYDWHFEPLSVHNHADCLRVLKAWDEGHEGSPLIAFERSAIERMLTYPEAHGQSGGLLYADGAPIAFAIGSHPRPALLDIVAEKALPAYVGSYAMMVQTYAEYAHSLAPFTWINREEDMGLENLRNAKQQLNPACLIEKTLMELPL